MLEMDLKMSIMHCFLVVNGVYVLEFNNSIKLLEGLQFSDSSYSNGIRKYDSSEFASGNKKKMYNAQYVEIKTSRQLASCKR